MIRILAAEALEHLRRAIPLLVAHEDAGRIVFGIGRDFRVRRQRRDAQEVIDRPARVAGLLLRFGLLVDGGRDPLFDRRAVRIVGRQEALHPHVGILGFRKAAAIEQRMRQQRSCGALVLRIDGRLAFENLL